MLSEELPYLLAPSLDKSIFGTATPEKHTEPKELLVNRQDSVPHLFHARTGAVCAYVHIMCCVCVCRERERERERENVRKRAKTCENELRLA
jgi:hypothetical protein